MRRRVFFAFVAGTALLPGSVRAQQKAMPVIGFLGSGSPAPAAQGLVAFRQALGEAGLVEGQNLTIEYRWAESRSDRLPALAADLVGRKVDAIVTTGGNSVARAAKNATSTIPIVFITGFDPVEAGVVASLARPGGNLTGVSILTVELNPKRLELLRELLPQARVIALLVNPNYSLGERIMREMQEAVHTSAVQLHVLKASTESEIAAAFATFVQRQTDALVVASDPFFFNQREQLVALAARHAIPTIYGSREYIMAGGLISYAASVTAAWGQIGIYVGRILKGAKPSDLPIVQPTTFELVINLKTAKTLGLAIPPLILARADEVIE